jgi:hypothetical protein
MCDRIGHELENVARPYWGGLSLTQKVLMHEALLRDCRLTSAEREALDPLETPR